MEMKLVSSRNKVPRKHMPEEYFELKNKIHDRLLNLIDLSLIESFDREVLKSQIRVIAQ
jgi:pilus assembly protein CpaF